MIALNLPQIAATLGSPLARQQDKIHPIMTPCSRFLARRTLVFLLTLALAAPVLAAPAAAATPAESFISENIQKGLVILNNRQLSVAQRRAQFETFLLSLTNMKRIADFTLGQYRRGASPADLTAFEAAFQDYAVAVYQSYFAKYAGQTLRVTGSRANGPDDFVVNTTLIDPKDHSGQPPLEVGFRVLTDRGKPEVDDFSVAGIWISQEERDQFTAYLGQNNGSIPMLITQLGTLAGNFK